MKPKTSKPQIVSGNIGSFFKESKSGIKSGLDKSFEYDDITVSKKNHLDDEFKKPEQTNSASIKASKISKNMTRSISCTQRSSKTRKSPKSNINIEKGALNQSILSFSTDENTLKISSDKENDDFILENKAVTALKNNKIFKKQRRSSSCNSILDNWVRKSKRCNNKEMKEIKANNLITDIINCKEEGMTIIHTELKGRGIESTKVFEKDSFVVEYAGDLITEKEAHKRELKYNEDPSKGSYMFYFKHGNSNFCVDATEESGRLGRLLNHSKKIPNCYLKVVTVKGKPRLAIFAKRDIGIGEELIYDYGDRDKATIEANPWLKY